MKSLAIALACAALTTTAAKGPPWVSIEMRPQGGGTLIARTFHHGTPVAIPLTGTAEGMVNGRRVSVPLSFEQDTSSNAFVIPRTWANEGVWVLNIGTSGDNHDFAAGVVVGLDRLGQVAFIRFPRGRFGSSRPATAGEVTAMLRALDAGTA